MVIKQYNNLNLTGDNIKGEVNKIYSMEKLIIQDQPTSVECDTPGCGFSVVTKEDIPLSDYVNTKCPKCDANLLTVDDYILYNKVFRKIAFINKWFSWITILFPYKDISNSATMEVKVHKDVTINIKK